MKQEMDLTPQKILTLIANHAVEFTKICQELIHNPDLEYESKKVLVEHLNEHHTWMAVLAALIINPSEETEEENDS